MVFLHFQVYDDNDDSDKSKKAKHKVYLSVLPLLLLLCMPLQRTEFLFTAGDPGKHIESTFVFDCSNIQACMGNQRKNMSRQKDGNQKRK